METVVGIADFSIEEVLARDDKLRCVFESRDHKIKLLKEKSTTPFINRFGHRLERIDERHQLMFGNDDATCEVKPATEIKVPEYTRNIDGRRAHPRPFLVFEWSVVCLKKRNDVSVVAT